jgi:hypothetical protein
MADETLFGVFASSESNYTLHRASVAMDREARLASAIEAYRNGIYKSVRGAARAHDVDHNTLTRRLNGAQSILKALELRQAISAGEEEALLNWLQRQQERGFPIHYRMLKGLAEYLIALQDNTHR